MVFAGALGGGKVADPSARDAETLGQRELVKALKEHERVVPAALPVGAGLVAAAVLPAV